jgi:hypothetical protein
MKHCLVDSLRDISYIVLMAITEQIISDDRYNSGLIGNHQILESHLKGLYYVCRHDDANVEIIRNRDECIRYFNSIAEAEEFINTGVVVKQHIKIAKAAKPEKIAKPTAPAAVEVSKKMFNLASFRTLIKPVK